MFPSNLQQELTWDTELRLLVSRAVRKTPLLFSVTRFVVISAGSGHEPKFSTLPWSLPGIGCVGEAGGWALLQRYPELGSGRDGR
jgi:hypothetical protein